MSQNDGRSIAGEAGIPGNGSIAAAIVAELLVIALAVACRAGGTGTGRAGAPGAGE